MKFLKTWINSKKLNSLRYNRNFLIVFLGLLLIIALFLAKSLLFAAFVNGRPISRISLIKQLETQGGSKVLANLIEKSLIFQEAGKQGVKIDKEVIDAEFTRIEGLLKEQNLTLEKALEMQGETKATLTEQIRLQKTIEAILGNKIIITDEEIQKYFEENKSLYPANTKFEDVKQSIREQLLQNKLSEEYAKWIEELRKNAKILYFVKYK